MILRTTSPIINIALANNGLGDRRVYDANDPGSEHQFKAPVTGKISAVYINYMDDPQHDPDQEIVYFTITRVSDNVQMSDAIFHGGSDARGRQPTARKATPFRSRNSRLKQGETYQLNVLLINGGPVVLGSFTIPIEPSADSTTPLINIALPNNNYGASPDDLVSKVTRFDAHSATARPSASPRLPAERSPASMRRIWATRTTIRSRKRCASRSCERGHVRFWIRRRCKPISCATRRIFWAEATTSRSISRLTVEKGGQYNFKVDLVSGGAVLSGGSVFTWEGAWDDPVPIGLCALPVGMTVEDDPPPGLYMDRRDCKGYLGFWDGLVQRLPAEHRLRG